MSRLLPLGLRALLATAIPLAVVGIGPWLLPGVSLPRALPWWRYTFVLPMLAGAALLMWSVLLFARDGRGTLAPIDPPTAFVVRGPYRVTRNPMYVGAMLWLAGLAALTGARPIMWYALIAAAWFHAFVVFVEEPGLRRRFGTSYANYVRRVPRWLGRRRDGPEPTSR